MSANYPNSRSPLALKQYIKLPLGAVKPQGWLRDQLVSQAEGLTGHLDEFYLVDSEWIGGGGHNRAWGKYAICYLPNYLEGLVPLAYLLEDNRLIEKSRRYIEAMVKSAHQTGWFGPGGGYDRWEVARAYAMRALIEYHEATEDERVISLVDGWFRYLKDCGVKGGGYRNNSRFKENLVAGYWLYNHTGRADLLEVLASICQQDEEDGDWVSSFLGRKDVTISILGEHKANAIRWSFLENRTATTHGVDIAQAIKYPGLIQQQFPTPEHKDAALAAIEYLDKYFGQVGGRFAAHEHLPKEEGRRPTHGTELCTIVEYMYSLEKLLEVFGDPTFADRLELLTFNSLPGACKGDFWAHQYDTQSNQVVVNVAARPWDNGPAANLYGLGPNYPCCLANMHQGWPRYVEHLWMATEDNGLVAMAYGPCEVTARVGGWRRVRILEDTEYPFDGEIRLTIDASEPVEFPLYLRIPAWETTAKALVNGAEERLMGGQVLCVVREWRSGDKIRLSFPMTLQCERQYRNSVAIRRGPVYFALRVGHEYRQRAQYHLGAADWEILPRTPWNMALAARPDTREGCVTLERRSIGSLPFAHRGEPVFLGENRCFTPWDQSEPLTLTMRGRQLNSWAMCGPNADDPPASPVESQGPDVVLELVPYGCTRLRVSVFPWLESLTSSRTSGESDASCELPRPPSP